MYKIMKWLTIWIFVWMAFFSIVEKLKANEIYMTQSGADVTVTITQDGENNRVSTKSTAASNATAVGKNQTYTFTQTGDDNKIGLYKHYRGSDGQSSGTMTAVQTGDGLIMYLDNHGDNNNFTTSQIHNNAIMDLEIDYSDNTVIAKQRCSIASCVQDRMILNVRGTDNNIKMGQGYTMNNSGNFVYDGDEDGGHYMDGLIVGNRNVLNMGQKSSNSSSGHDADVNINGDDNVVNVKQEHNSSKDLTLTINNDDNEVDIHQQKNWSHSANITLGGNYGTDLSLTQGNNNTSQAQSYSLNQNCQTSNGCSVTVTQY